MGRERRGGKRGGGSGRGGSVVDIQHHSWAPPNDAHQMGPPKPAGRPRVYQDYMGTEVIMACMNFTKL